MSANVETWIFEHYGFQKDEVDPERWERLKEDYKRLLREKEEFQNMNPKEQKSLLESHRKLSERMHSEDGDF